jgi:membrane protease YdiL (CAAX protease family)
VAEPTQFAILLRIGLFAFAGILTLQIAAAAFGWLGIVLQATLGVFAAAAVANGMALRVFERASVTLIGLAWKNSSLRHLGLGLAGGLGSAWAITLLPALVGAARYEANPESALNLGSVAFVSFAMLFGAMGEELLFHGYAFQLMMAKFGAFATLLPVGVLFAFAHENNLGANPLSFFNTFLWGVFLGLCFLRSGDLWLPIGVHYGWNLALSLAGAQVSGMAVTATGYRLAWNTPSWVSGGGYGPEAGLLCTLILPVLGYALFKAPIQTETPPLLSSVEE